MKTQYLLELDSDPPSWVDGSDGDPGRTCVKERARVFLSKSAAAYEANRLSKLYGRRVRAVAVTPSAASE